MRHLQIALAFLCLIFCNLNAQVGIGTTTPDPSSSLDIASNNSGVLVPRMEVSERIGITLPADGLLVYQTNDVAGFYYFNGMQWVRLMDKSRDDVPTASIFAFPIETAPTGYLVCDGSAVNRATYADLFAVIGVTYGNGNGTTTFNLPDYRGQFLRGLDEGSGTDPGAASRTDRGDGTTGNFVGTKQSSEVVAHDHNINAPASNTTSEGLHDHTIAGATINTSNNGNHGHNTSTISINTNSVGNHTHNSSSSTSGAPNHNHRVPYSNITVRAAGGFGTTNTTIRQVGGGYSSSYVTTQDGNHNHFNSGLTSASGNHNHNVSIPSQSVSSGGIHTHSVTLPSQTASSNGNHLHAVDIPDFNSDTNSGLESRPTNVNVVWCIKF
tara:strand:- start:80 stop:1225 length:1146 start_codon:yes stop_codon:yes gene_type:complete